MADGPIILVADDEDGITNLIADALTDEGYLVDTVADGKAALRATEQHLPMLIVLDDMMPGMRGIEIVAHLRQNGDTSTPVIMISAATPAETCLRHGATAFLAKPFSLDALLDQVERLAPVRAREVGLNLPTLHEYVPTLPRRSIGLPSAPP